MYVFMAADSFVLMSFLVAQSGTGGHELGVELFVCCRCLHLQNVGACFECVFSQADVQRVSLGFCTGLPKLSL